DGDAAAGRELPGDPGDQVDRLELVGYEVQHRDQEHDRGLGRVDEPAQVRIGEDDLGVAQVGVDDGGAVVARQDGAPVGDGGRVPVHVDDAGVWVDLLGHIVDVALGGDAGAEVDELVDAGLAEVAYASAQEGPVDAGQARYVGHRLQDLLGELAVDGEVMRS